MIFLKEGGKRPCHAGVGRNHPLNEPRQEWGDKIFFRAGLKLQAFWVVMRPPYEQKTQTFNRPGILQIKALVFLNGVIRNSKGKNTCILLQMFEKPALCLDEQWFKRWGLPCWSGGWDFAFQCRCRGAGAGVQVRSLVGEVRFHMPHGQKKQNLRQKQYCSKFNEDFKNGPH